MELVGAATDGGEGHVEGVAADGALGHAEVVVGVGQKGAGQPFELVACSVSVEIEGGGGLGEGGGVRQRFPDEGIVVREQGVSGFIRAAVFGAEDGAEAALVGADAARGCDVAGGASGANVGPVWP